MAKCENCYHARACLNSLSENKGLNNTESFVCEHCGAECDSDVLRGEENGK